MGKVESKTTSTDKLPGEGTDLVILKTVADTTWRLFLPSIGLTVLGIIADKILDTKPWMTFIGVTIGAILSFTLVYGQLKGIKKSEQ